MATLSNVQSPVRAIPGKMVALSVEVGVGSALTGETHVVVWDGNAPSMPYSEVITFGSTWFGDSKTLYYNFRMPDAVVRFRVVVTEKSCFVCESDQTPYYSITPGKEEIDPNEEPGGWFKSIAEWFGGLGSTLLWIVIAFTALVVIGYVVKKKGAAGSKPPRP